MMPATRRLQIRLATLAVGGRFRRRGLPRLAAASALPIGAGLGARCAWVVLAAVLWVLSGLAGLSGRAVQAAEEGRFSVAKWSYSRERKTVEASNRVVAQFEVKNLSLDRLEGVKVIVTFCSAMGQKVAGPFQKDFETLKPGETVPVTVAGTFVAAFDAYEIVLAFDGGRERFVSPSDQRDPRRIPEGLLPGVAQLVVLGQELAVNPKTSEFGGRVRVRNLGQREATEAKIQIAFHAAPLKAPPPPAASAKGQGKEEKGSGKEAAAAGGGPEQAPPQAEGKKLWDWSGMLGKGSLAAGAEEIFPVTVPWSRGAFPKFHSYSVQLSCKESSLEAQLAGSDFKNLKEVEAARWRFVRTGKGEQDLKVSCSVRNGLEEKIEQVKLRLIFFKGVEAAKKPVKEFTYPVPGVLGPDQVVEVAFEIPGVPEFDSYEESREFERAKQPLAVQAAGAGKKELAFQNADTVEVLFQEFLTHPDGTLMVVCAARNGRPNLVRNLAVKLTFSGAGGKVLTTAEKVIQEPMLPGDVRNFVIRVSGADGFKSYNSEVDFVEAKGEPKKDSKEVPEAPAPTPGEGAGER